MIFHNGFIFAAKVLCDIFGAKGDFSPLNKKIRFRAETSNASADSTVCTVSEHYDVFSAKGDFSPLNKKIRFLRETTIISRGSTICTARRIIGSIRGER